MDADNRVCPQPWTRWEDEPGPGASTERQGMGVKTMLEIGLQLQSKVVGDRQKERTGSPVLSRGYGTQVRLMGPTKSSQCHRDPISWCRLESRTSGNSNTCCKVASPKYLFVPFGLRSLFIRVDAHLQPLPNLRCWMGV